MAKEKHKASIKEWPEDERPREKAFRYGISTLSKAELLAILIGSGTVDESAVELMKRVLASCGNNIGRLARLSVEDLCLFKGIGPAKAISIVAACELWKRRQDDERDRMKRIYSSRNLYEYFYPLLCDKPIEECYVLLLNQMNCIIGHVRIGSGGLTSTAVDIRLVLRSALLKCATGVALCHNHPSGSLHPSIDDDRLTTTLLKACKIMNIRLLDHIILTDGAYYSYADEQRL